MQSYNMTTQSRGGIEHAHIPSCENQIEMKPSFRFAMLAFAILGILAAFTLDGLLRIACLVALAGFALKTLIAHKAGW